MLFYRIATAACYSPLAKTSQAAATLAVLPQAVLRLFKAATAGDTLELEKLLASANVASHISCEDEDSWTPLHHAVDGNHLAAAMVLVSCSADVNAANSASNTPLHLALRWSFVEIALFLLAQPGISANAQVRSCMQMYCPEHMRLCGLQHIVAATCML